MKGLPLVVALCVALLVHPGNAQTPAALSTDLASLPANEATSISVSFSDSCPASSLTGELVARQIRLTAIDAVTKDFAIHYRSDVNETTEHALQSTLEHIRNVQGRLEESVRETGVPLAPFQPGSPCPSLAPGDLCLTKVALEGTASQLRDFADTVRIPPSSISTIGSMSDPVSQQMGELKPTPNLLSAVDDAWRYSPTRGSIQYYGQGPKYFYSWFSWDDVSAFTYPIAAYEHDIVIRTPATGAQYVKQTAVWVSNLPGAYLDDPTFDSYTILTIGSWMCTTAPCSSNTVDNRVAANTGYFVYIVVEPANEWNAPATVDLTPQIGSYRNWYDPIEAGWCASHNSFIGSCVFARETNVYVNYYQGLNLLNPVYTRFPFDHHVSRTFQWDRSITTQWKTCPESMFRAEYFDTTNVGNSPDLRLVQCESSIGHLWGSSSPDPTLSPDGFSVHWTGRPWLSGRRYLFSGHADDGFRLYVDGVQQLSTWNSPAGTYADRVVQLTPGSHTLAYEMREDYGTASTHLGITSLPPNTPQNLSASVVNPSTLSLVWSNLAPDMDGYTIQYRSSFVWSSATVPYPNRINWSISGLAPGTTYSVRLSAYNAAGGSPWTNEVTVTLPSLAPAAPSNLTVSISPPANITLTWRDNSSDEAWFYIDALLPGSSSWTSPYGMASANATSWIVSLAAGSTYSFRVRAYSNGSSAASNVVTVTTPVAPPPAPTSLSATSPTSGALALSWQYAGATLGGFSIERSDSGTGSYTVYATTGATNVSFSGLSPGARYDLRVRAWNASGWSAYTNVATVTITGAAAWVTLLSESFEASPPGWTVSSPWVRQYSTASYSGLYRLKFGSTTTYPNNTNVSATSPSFSLSGRTQATLSFAFKYDTELHSDFLYVELSSDGGSTWLRIHPSLWSGLSPGGANWDVYTFEFGSSHLGKPNVRLRFRFTSNASVTRWGAAIDAVRVTAQ